jgi:hypothetical protein
LPETKPTTSALDILNYFQEYPSQIPVSFLLTYHFFRGKAHMVLVSDHPGESHGALGVVTLEDVIEELIGEEIVDETDVFVDVSRHLKRMNPAAAFAHHSFHRISSRNLHRGSADSGHGNVQSTPLSRDGSYYTTPPSRNTTIGTMKPMNLAQEPLSTHSTKVTIKPGAEVRNAQQAATVLSQEERLAGKRAAREGYGTMSPAGVTTTFGGEAETNGQVVSRSAAGPSLIEERITVSDDSRRPSKVVISPVLEARHEGDHEGSPLL